MKIGLKIFIMQSIKGLKLFCAFIIFSLLNSLGFLFSLYNGVFHKKQPQIPYRQFRRQSLIRKFDPKDCYNFDVQLESDKENRSKIRRTSSTSLLLDLTSYLEKCNCLNEKSQLLKKPQFIINQSEVYRQRTLSFSNKK